MIARAEKAVENFIETLPACVSLSVLPVFIPPSAFACDFGQKLSWEEAVSSPTWQRHDVESGSTNGHRP